MGFKLTQRVIDLRGGLMTPAQKAALTVISRYADDETGGNSFPTLETIARKTEFNRRTILEAVNALIADGWISAVRTRYGRIFTVSISKVSENQEEDSRCAGNSTSDVQEVTHVQDHAHVQETASRCAGNSTSDVQEVTHRRDQLKEQEEITSYVDAPQSVDVKTDDSDFSLTNEPSEKVKPRTLPCPYMKIIELYHQILPMLPGVQIITTDRQAQMRARWKFFVDNSVYTTEADILKLFRTYFELVRSQNFLLGRDSNSDRPWRANFDWLLKEKNFTKVWEKTYVRK